MKYDIVKLMARRKIRWKKRWVSGDSGGRLTFRSKKAGRLSDYRIYGNTVGGESVGDLVESGEHSGEYKVPVTVSNGTDTLTANLYLPEPIKMVGGEAEFIDYGEQKMHRVRKNLFNINNLKNGYDISLESGLPTQGSPYSFLRCAITTPINVSAGDYYLTFNKNIENEIGFIVSVFENNTFISRISGYHSGDRIQISSGNNIYIGFYSQNLSDVIHTSDIFNIMLNSGSEPLPYEPYIENVDLDVILPALPTLPGTNVLSVGTAVQPSRVEVKGRIKAVGQETEPEQEAAEAEQEAAEPEQEEPEVKEDDTDDR